MMGTWRVVAASAARIAAVVLTPPTRSSPRPPDRPLWGVTFSGF
jgi:hypothetical protein